MYQKTLQNDDRKRREKIKKFNQKNFCKTFASKINQNKISLHMFFTSWDEMSKKYFPKIL